MGGSIHIRALGTLAELVRGEGAELSRPLPEGATTKSLAEGIGIPHTEIDGIALDGRWVGLGGRPEPGASLVLHPFERPRRVPPRARLLPDEGEPPTFVLDVHLGSLARRLRLGGFDARFDPALDDAQIAALSVAESRVILTKDRRLLMRKAVARGCLIRSEALDRQLAQVFARFALGRWLHPLARCVRCNGLIEPVDKAEIVAQLEPGTRREYEEFRRCTRCGRVYWRGAHYARLLAHIDLLRVLAGAG